MIAFMAALKQGIIEKLNSKDGNTELVL